MTDDKKIELKKRMDELLDKYNQQLPNKYHDLEKSWQLYQSDYSNPAFIETFYRLIHTLKGTAATFGFNTQADICFEIQKLLLDVKETNAKLPEENIHEIEAYLNELKNNISAPADDMT